MCMFLNPHHVCNCHSSLSPSSSSRVCALEMGVEKLNDFCVKSIGKDTAGICVNDLSVRKFLSVIFPACQKWFEIVPKSDDIHERIWHWMNEVIFMCSE